MLYCILGNSGSGKNTILEKLLKKPESIIKDVEYKTMIKMEDVCNE